MSGETEAQGPWGHFAARPTWLRMVARCPLSQTEEMKLLLQTMGVNGDANPGLGWERRLCKMDTGIFSLNYKPVPD